MTGHPDVLLLALIVAATAGAAAGWWLSRRGYRSGVRELQARLQGWEDVGGADEAAPIGVGGAVRRPARRRPAVMWPLFEQVEERRRSYLTLRTLSDAHASRLQKLMDVIGEGVLLYDVRGQLLFVNGRLRELARAAGESQGEESDESVLRRVGDLLEAGSDIPSFVKEVLERDAEPPETREVHIRAGGHERRFVAATHLIRTKREHGCQGLLLVLTDVEALEQMRESGRCQVALDHVRLAAELMAHRVRNPLNSIVLVLELIRRDVAGEPEHRNLDTIQGEVEQLEKRLQKFLDMVRRREHRPEVVDLVTVVEVVCELLFGPARDARVTVRQQLHVSSARVRGDEVELLRAVLGPCAAALRKSSPGAELKVGLDSDQREHLVFVECPELEPGSIALTVAEELVAGSGGALTYDDPRHPTRLTYRFPAGPSAEPSPR